MTARDIIKASLRLIGATAAGETPPAEELNDGLAALNLMLGEWSSERLMVYAVTKESFTLTAGKESYTAGAGGELNTVRPQRVEGAFTRDASGTDRPVRLASREEYGRLSLKTTPGRPEMLYYHAAYPLATVYLYPAPDAAYELHLDSWKPFTGFASLDDTVSLPPAYEQAVKYNLAVGLAPEYGVAVAPEVAALAGRAMGRIEGLNAAAEATPARFDEIPGTGERFDINAG